MENGTDTDSIDTTDPLVWVGFCCAILSVFGSTAALMLIRKSTAAEAHKPLCQRKWLFIGTWANTACEIGLTSVALAFTPLALLSPISGLSIVFACIFAWVGLCGNAREKASPQEVVGLLLTLVGVTVCSIYGPKGGEEIDLVATNQRVLGWRHMLYFGVGWTVALCWLALHTFSRLRHLRPTGRRADVISAPISGFTSGYLASYSLSLFKIIVTNVRSGFAHGNWLQLAQNWLIWVALVVFVPTGALQIYSLNVTMGSGAANYVFPCYTVAIIILSAVVAGIIFDDFAALPPSNILMFVVGCAITVVGLFGCALIQARRHREGAGGAKDGKPTPPPGYVMDSRCYFCAIRVPCIRRQWGWAATEISTIEPSP